MSRQRNQAQPAAASRDPYELLSWILSMWPNIYPIVDGEVAYAVNPITGLPMVTFKSSFNASIPNTVTLTLLRDVHIDTLM